MTRQAYLESQRSKGRRLIGVFPAHYPQELLWAFNCVPVEIWDPPTSCSDSGVHLQPYICSIVRSGLDLVLRGKTEFLDGFLLPHTCDSIQNLASLLNDYLKPPKPVYFLYHPKEPYRRGCREFLRSQYELLLESLERDFGPPEPGKLARALETGIKIRERIGRLYSLLALGRLEVKIKDFYRTMRLGEYLHPEDFLARLEPLAGHESPYPPRSPRRPRVVLSGVLPNPPELLDLLDDLRVGVGGDDFLALSRRYLPWKPQPAGGEGGDPLDMLLDAYFALPPCSTKGSSLTDRLAYLMDIITKSSSQGVIFWQIKYCEPELFDVPFLAEELRKTGIKVLVLETEINQGLSGQMATRVEAFAETLEG